MIRIRIQIYSIKTVVDLALRIIEYKIAYTGFFRVDGKSSNKTGSTIKDSIIPKSQSITKYQIESNQTESNQTEVTHYTTPTSISSSAES